LEMDDFKSNIYEVFDLQGRKVLTGMLTSNQTNISISKLSKGTYTIGIQGHTNKVVFVKE
ncbi:MAG: T9SS type A sorting domain-containing protein, partial [Crocinitomicaceae bacterium]